MIHDTEPKAQELYADIFDLPHWRPQHHKPMSLWDRAAQFSAYKALAGSEDMVDEDARQVDAEEALSETELSDLNRQITRIGELLEDGMCPDTAITYFVPDPHKAGGCYVTVTDTVRRIDTVNRRIELMRRIGVSGSYMTIDMDAVSRIRLIL